MKFEISSSAFSDGSFIPAKYTGDGPDVSPPLSWTNAPQGTKSFALVCDDPDAPVGTWVHWVIYCIPAGADGLEENIPGTDRVPETAVQGQNDFRRVGYGGPAPPPGKPHRYFFKLYALDTELKLEPGLTKAQLPKAMEGHILGTARFMGKYQRN